MKTDKVLAKTKGDSVFSGPSHNIECCLCGENDRNEIKIEDIGISAGMGGDDYSFCFKCWESKFLGKNLLDFLGCPDGLKLKDESLELRTVSQ